MKVLIIPLALAVAMAGCAEVTPPPPIKVTSDTFCAVKKALNGGNGKQSWSKSDTSTTIDAITRENAAVDRRCKTSSPKTS